MYLFYFAVFRKRKKSVYFGFDRNVKNIKTSLYTVLFVTDEGVMILTFSQKKKKKKEPLNISSAMLRIRNIFIRFRSE